MANNLALLGLKTVRNSIWTASQTNGSRVICRSMATPAIHPAVKAKQDKFQSDNDAPVHLKGGITDQILYRITMGACVLSIAIIAKSFFTLATKK